MTLGWVSHSMPLIITTLHDSAMSIIDVSGLRKLVLLQSLMWIPMRTLRWIFLHLRLLLLIHLLHLLLIVLVHLLIILNGTKSHCTASTLFHLTCKPFLSSKITVWSDWISTSWDTSDSAISVPSFSAKIVCLEVVTFFFLFGICFGFSSCGWLLF